MAAQIYPRDWENTIPKPTFTEIAFGRFLADQLDPEWIIFPNFHWVRSAEEKGKSFGEIDFLVLSPRGILHIVEVKDNTNLFSKNGNLFVKYKNKEQPTNVNLQVHSSESAISSTLRRMNLPFRLRTVRWLLLPSAAAPQNVGFPKENIHDSTRRPGPYESLTAAIIATERLGDGIKNTQSLVPYFAQELSLTITPDIFARKGLIGYISESNPDFRAVSSIMVIQVDRPKIYVDGPAGSGKTQIGLQLAVKAAREGRSAAICTHTKAMRDEIGRGLGGRSVPGDVWVVKAPHAGRIIIGTVGGVSKFIDEESTYSPDCDIETVVIEEAHAISSEKIEALRARLSVGYVPHLYLLVDARQHIHKVQEFTINFRLNSTYRSPRRICDFINDLHRPEYAVSTYNRHDGEVIIQSDFDTDEEATESAIKIAREMISEGGLDGSQVAILIMSNQGELGALRSRLPDFRTLDDQDYMNHPVVETVSRFQGFSRPMILLVNIREEDSWRLRGYIYLAATRSSDTFAILTTKGIGARIQELQRLKLGPARY